MKSKFVCKLNFGVDVKFFGSRQPLGYNVFALYFRLGFETLSTEKLLTKINVFFAFAKQKLINCQTAFANAEAECPN